MNNVKWLGIAGQLALASINFALVFWLVEGNFALKIFLAGVMTTAEWKSIELKELRTLFDISDNQVVYLSQRVERFEENENDWNEVRELKNRIQEMELQLDGLLHPRYRDR